MPTVLRVLVAAAMITACGESEPSAPSTAPGEPALAASGIPPLNAGPYNVGYRVLTATMTGGRIARVQVHYPTPAGPECQAPYQIQSPAGVFSVRSTMCAAQNAQVAAGPFPTVIYDHGGPVAGADFQRAIQAPLHEYLASHGFVVVLGLHSADPVARIRDLKLLTDFILARSADPSDPFAGRIDPARLGASAFSAGGAAAFHLAAGFAAAGIAPDPRIRAMAVHEPFGSGIDLADAAGLSIPYLIMAGSQSRGGTFAPVLFAATTSAAPRIYVRSEGAVHVNYLSGICELIADAREQAIVADPVMAEPLTVLTATSAAASAAFTQWNAGQLNLTATGPGFGGGRNICNRMGVGSARSLDGNGDGITDSPPFLTGVAPFVDPTTSGPSPAAEVMTPVVKLYTLAFFKKFLAGDHRYMPYLTPGYAAVQNLPAVVDIEP